VAALAALRPALEGLVERASTEPEDISSPSENDQALMGIIRAACKPEAATYGVNNSQHEQPHGLG